MLTVAQANWPHYFERITHRYAGQVVILRQREPDDEQEQVVLWRTPLRAVTTTPHPLGSYVTIVAGQYEPFIEISLGLAQRVALSFGPDQSLHALHIASLDGTNSILLFLEEEHLNDWI